MASEIKVTDKGRRLIENRLVLLDELRVLVGVQGPEAARPHPSSRDTTQGEVAALIQNGDADTPARPFLDVAIAEIGRDLGPAAQAAAKRVASKRKSAVSLALKPLGRAAASAVREAVVEVGAVGTGATRDAVSYTVRDGSDRIIERGKPDGR